MPLTNSEKEFLLGCGLDDGVRTEFYVSRVKFTGEISRTDLFCREKLDQQEHPFYLPTDALPYITKVADSGTVLLPENDSVEAISIDDQEMYSGNAKLIDFINGNTNWLTFADTNLVALGGSYGFYFSSRSEQVVIKAPFTYPFNQTVDDTITVSGAYRSPDQWSVPWCMKVGRDMVGYKAGYYRFPTGPVAGSNVWELLQNIDIGDSVWDTDAPLVCRPGVSATDIPHIPNRRRVYISSNGNSNGSWSHLMVGYLKGVGDDIVVTAVTVTDGAGYLNNLCISQGVVQRIDGWMPKLLGMTSTSSLKGYYPLSGATMFYDRLQCAFSLSPTTQELVGSVNVYFTEVTADTKSVWGTISTEDYQQYLSTGFGVYTPLKGDALTAVLNSWIKLAVAGVGYKIKTVGCSGRSLKETSFYQQYGRARAKACKDNNYMDLPYNQEYTMKQVENKLSSVISRNVWIQPVNERPSAPADFVPVKTVTINDLNANQFTATSATFGTLTYNKTEDSISLFLDKHPDFIIKDTNNVLSVVIGVDVDGTNLSQLSTEQSSGVKPSNFDLRIGKLTSGYTLDYEEAVQFLTIDSEIGYLCSQLTDYVNFNQKVVTLNNQFKFSEVKDAIVKTIQSRPDEQ